MRHPAIRAFASVRDRSPFCFCIVALAQRGTLPVSRCAFQGCPQLRNSAFAGAEGARAADRVMKQRPGLDMKSEEQSSGSLARDPSDLFVYLELLQHDESFFEGFTE